MSEYYLLLESEELETIVKKAMRDVLEEYGLRPIPLEPPSEEDIKVLAALGPGSSSEQGASNLGVSERELRVRIGVLKEAGYLVGAQNYESLREVSSQLLSRFGKEAQAIGH